GHGVDGAAAQATVRPLDRYDRVRALREGGAGHDARRVARGDGGEFGAARRDVPHHTQHGGGLLVGALHVPGAYRVAVHRAVVEGRQRGGDGDVLQQDAALRVEEMELDGLQRADATEDVLQVLLDRPGLAQGTTSPR